MSTTKKHRLGKELLHKLYEIEKLSSSQIAKKVKCSTSKVDYWLKAYQIPKRSIAEAVYQKHNPNGDPFSVVNPNSAAEFFLLGLGIGLYWGEGTKRNRVTVRLGNSDPALIRVFVQFLERCFGVNKKQLRFGLQIFSDMPKAKAERYWKEVLSIDSNQLYKTIITPARSLGTYREKSPYGVMTVYMGNRKLRDILCSEIEKMRTFSYNRAVPAMPIAGEIKPM